MKEIENDTVQVWFEEGIVFLKFQKDTVLNLEAIKQTIELGENFSVEEKQYVVCDITNVKSATSEAREYGSKHGQNGIYACAVLVNSYFTKFLFTSYIKFSKPDFPFAVFISKEKAVKWLLEIKAKNEQGQSF